MVPMSPLAPLMLLILGCVCTAGLATILGWFVLPAGDRTIKVVGTIHQVVILTMMAVAAVLVACVFMSDTHSPREAFNIIPAPVLAAILLFSFATSGLARGLSIKKNKRWV